MLTREQIEVIGRVESDRFPIVSLYLDLPRDRDESSVTIHLKNLISEVEEEASRYRGEARDSLERDVERIQRLVREELLSGARALAVFTSHGLGMWHTFRSYLPLPNRVRVGPRAYLKPLLRLFAYAGQYAAALVDKSRARLWAVSAEGARELASFEAPVPGKHDQGGWSQARFQRHHQDHVQRHLKETAEELLRRHQRDPFRALFISGPEPVIDQFAGMLHPYLKEILAGHLGLAVAGSAQQVHQTVLERIVELERQEEGRLLDALRTQAGKGNLGVLGLEETLRALQQGQVRELLVDSGFRHPGARCAACRSLTLDTQGSCPYCGGRLEPLRDVVAEAVEEAFQQDARVHFLESDARKSSGLGELGHVGAILRFPSSQPESEEE